MPKQEKVTDIRDKKKNQWGGTMSKEKQNHSSKRESRGKNESGDVRSSTPTKKSVGKVIEKGRARSVRKNQKRIRITVKNRPELY